MKKQKLAITIGLIFSSSVFATNYNVIANNEDYTVKEELDRIIYTEWIEDGDAYDCENDQETDDFYLDRPFTQITTCSQDFTRKKQTYKGNLLISEEDEFKTTYPQETNQKLGTLLLENCTRILNQGHSLGNGVYTITTFKGNIDVLCDMNIDGGGWTLVTYAGNTINGKKSDTAKSGIDKLWNPLMFEWGTMLTDSPTSRVSFSRFDYFNDIKKPNDEFLAKRTTVPNKMIIFPIVNTEWFGRDFSEGHFSINNSNNKVPYLKLTKTGNSGWKTVTNNVFWSYVNSDSSGHPGINWNVSESENCDSCGRSFETALNHRSLLYWESYSELTSEHFAYRPYWWHASPMTLEDSTGPKNTVLDMEFWYREK